MGIGISSLPDRLNEMEVKEISGHWFDKGEFDAMRDENGFITKIQMLAALNSRCESYAKMAFYQVCPQGNLDLKSFELICRDSFLIDEFYFTSSDCNTIFDQLFERNRSSLYDGVSYDEFRYSIVPYIAEMKGVHEMFILLQISQVYNSLDPDTSDLNDDDSEENDAKTANNIPKTGNQCEDESKQISNNNNARDLVSSSEVGGIAEDSKYLHSDKVILVVEPIAPSAPARGEGCVSCPPAGGPVHATTEGDTKPRTSDFPRRPDQPSGFVGGPRPGGVSMPTSSTSEPPNAPAPAASNLWSVFYKFCPSGLMASGQFLMLLRSAKLLGDDFTAGDAEVEFVRAKASVAGPLVTAAQRVGFDIFCSLLVPSIARQRGQSVARVIAALSATAAESEPESEQIHVLTSRRSLVLLDVPASVQTGAGAGECDDYPQNKAVLVENTDEISRVVGLAGSKLRQVFLQCTPSGHLSLNQFIKLLQRKDILNANFGRADAQSIYEEVTRSARNLDTTKTLRGISFDIFCSSIIPAVAVRRSEAVERTVSAFCEDVAGAVRSGRGDSCNAPESDTDRPNFPDISNVSSSFEIRHSVNRDGVAATQRKQLLALFNAFCPSGEMSSVQFTRMMKSLDLFSADFNRRDAELIYIRTRSSFAGQKISFQDFSTTMLREVAEKRGQTVASLQASLAAVNLSDYVESEVEFVGPASSGPGLVLGRLPHDGPAEVRQVTSPISRFPKKTNPNVMPSVNPLPSPLYIRAPPLLEDNLVEVHFNVKSRRPSYGIEEGVLSRLRPVFLDFAPSGELLPFQFIRMMRDLDLFTPTYSRRDAEVLYNSLRANASEVEGGLSGLKPRVTLEVFCLLGIPVIADKRGEAVETVIDTIVGEYIKMKNMSEALPAESSDFHDDGIDFRLADDHAWGIPHTGMIGLEEFEDFATRNAQSQSQSPRPLDRPGPGPTRPKSGPSHAFRKFRSVRDPIPEHNYDPIPEAPTALKRPLSGPSNLRTMKYNGPVLPLEPLTQFRSMKWATGCGTEAEVEVPKAEDELDILEDDSGESPGGMVRPAESFSVAPCKEQVGVGVGVSRVLQAKAPAHPAASSQQGKRPWRPFRPPRQELRPGAAGESEQRAPNTDAGNAHPVIGVLPQLRSIVMEFLPNGDSPAAELLKIVKDPRMGDRDGVVGLASIMLGEGPRARAFGAQPDVRVDRPGLLQVEAPKKSPRRHSSPRAHEDISAPPMPPREVETHKGLQALFSKFSPSGEMIFNQFVRLLRHTKVLDSVVFTVADAEVVFAPAKVRAAGGGRVPVNQRVGFELFCSMIIPAIAKRRVQSVADLLAFMDKSVVAMKSISGVHGARQRGMQNVSVAEHDSHISAPPVMMSVSPRRPALQQSPRQSVAAGSAPAIKRAAIYRELLPVFSEYSVDGEMSLTQFLKLLTDANLFNKIFRRSEAELVYIKAKSAISGGMLGAFVDDKVGLEAFCSILVPVVAEKRGEAVDDVWRVFRGHSRANVPVHVPLNQSRVHGQKTPRNVSPRFSRAANNRVLEEAANNDDLTLLLSLFAACTTTDELSSDQFVRMLEDTAMIDKEFTAEDAEVLFEDVQGGGRVDGFPIEVTFTTFCSLLLPALAVRKKLRLEFLVKTLVARQKRARFWNAKRRPSV